MSVVSGIAGAQAQTHGANVGADAITNAAQISADALLEMFNQQMGMQQPFQEAGVEALGQLSSADPTGGAANYMSKINKLGLDLPEFSYEFNPDDPAYKFKLEESQKVIDRASAARGNYNSRAAINAIADSARAITAEEATSQYGRAKDIYGMKTARAMDLYKSDYGKNFDLYNMAMGSGAANVGLLQNLVNAGLGAASSAGAGASSTGQGLASIYSNMGSSLADIAMAQGTNLAQLYSGMGQSGINAYMMYMANKPGNTGKPAQSSGGSMWV